ncbi:MAG: S8 family serine peptidase, partial [Bacteroidota bacterium]
MRKKQSKKKENNVKIAVSVHESSGILFEGDAVLTLTQGRSQVKLKKGKDHLYKADVTPGIYQLSAEAGKMMAPTREVTITDQGKTTCVYVGRKSWPKYRMGDNIVPFQFKKELIAFCFPTRLPKEKEIKRIDSSLKKKFKLKPFILGKEQENHMVGNGSIWIYEMNNAEDALHIRREARNLTDIDIRIGSPVDLSQGQVKVIDNQFVIRFKNHLKPNQIDGLVKDVQGRSLRKFIQAPNAHLVEFLEGDLKDHLNIIESWYKEKLLVYGEPNILAEIEDDVFPADPPNDTLYGTQANLTLQNADDAWQFLNGINPNITLGSTNVTVCSIDRGIDTDHPDIGGNLTDGLPQLSQCYDFSGMQPCTVAGYTPDTDHGMGVYGIIAANTDNNSGISGIAPNTHQIGLERPSLTAVHYGDMLLWAAGFVTNNTTSGWPAEPIANPADIISCSHGSNGLALSGLMDDTFEYLATYGRGGLGTLMIYSAGNGAIIGGVRVAQLITGFRTWAAHPRTMAIGNSNQPNAMGVEVKNNSSNFGPELDICAQGNGAPSLDSTGGTQTFGGTSAAAPTVAAAAALMLSVEDRMTWINLRDTLRNTAVVIDPLNANPVGQWVGGFSQWYGFGRLNILAAVQGANTFDPGSVNLVIRENQADNGQIVPSGGVFYRSSDIWIRNADPSTEGIGDPAYNVDPPHLNAISGGDNWVRVRVKNVGTAASSNFFVRLYLTHFAGSQFVYPNDYIPSGNPGDPIPSPLVLGTYLIGEQFVNTIAANTDAIYNFQWPAALVPPEIVGGTRWHPCLLAEVSPHTGPTPSGNLVYDNSNLGQRNITIDYSDDNSDDTFEATGVIGNATDFSRSKRIVLHKGSLPKSATIWIRFLDERIEKDV